MSQCPLFNVLRRADMSIPLGQFGFTVDDHLNRNRDDRTDDVGGGATTDDPRT
jgi:hypothetical protein